MEFEQNLSIQRELLWNRQYISIALIFCLFLNGLNVTIVDSRRSLCTSSDVSQTYNFPVAFSARTDVDLFTCFRKNPNKNEREKKPDDNGKFCLTAMFPLHVVKFLEALKHQTTREVFILVARPLTG